MNEYCLYCDSLILNDMTWHRLFFPAPAQKLCKTCRDKLQPLTGTRCITCSRSLDDLSPEYIKEDTCLDCVRWEEDPDWKDTLHSNTSLFQYNDFLKEFMARFKYRGDYVLAQAFSLEIKKSLDALEFDAIVPIPLSDERLQERGFNQSAALAKDAGFDVEDLLIRIHGEKQSKKSRAERIHLKEIFQIREPLESNQKILLIDDIYTTGSTVRHAARTLKQAGAERVFSFTLIRG